MNQIEGDSKTATIYSEAQGVYADVVIPELSLHIPSKLLEFDELIGEDEYSEKTIIPYFINEDIPVWCRENLDRPWELSIMWVDILSVNDKPPADLYFGNSMRINVLKFANHKDMALFKLRWL